MSIRDDRAAAIKRYYRDLGDSLERALPALLDALDAVDVKHRTTISAGIADAALDHERALIARGDLTAGPAVPPDEWVTAWIKAHPDEFATWVRKQDRIEGGSPGETTGTRTAAATRRRTTRKDTTT